MREPGHGLCKMLLGGMVPDAALMLPAAAGMQFSNSRPFCSTSPSWDEPHSRAVAHRMPILRATNVTLSTICLPNFRSRPGMPA